MYINWTFSQNRQNCGYIRSYNKSSGKSGTNYREIVLATIERFRNIRNQVFYLVNKNIFDFYDNDVPGRLPE